MTVRIGYVGLDHHHREPYLATIDTLDADVVATADPDGHRPAELGADRLEGLPCYESVTTLVEEEAVDLVWLTLPNARTPAAIEAAVSAGVDVMSEKPGARTAADLEPVADTAAGSDATVGLAYTWREHPIAVDLHERAGGGFFGGVRGFDLRFVASKLETRPTDHYLFDAEASRGGIVQWLGVHWLDLLPWLLDYTVSWVRADLTHGFDGVDVEDGAMVTLGLESGAVGTLTAGYWLREGRYDTAIEIWGGRGRASWDPMGPTFGFDGETRVVYDGDDWPSTPRREVVHEYEPSSGYGGRWGRAFFEQFLAACSGNANNPARLEEGLRVLRILDAVYESAECGERVAVQ